MLVRQKTSVIRPHRLLKSDVDEESVKKSNDFPDFPGYESGNDFPDFPGYEPGTDIFQRKIPL